MTSFIDANVIVKSFTDNNDKEKCRAALQEEFITNILCLVEAQDAISKISGNKVYAANCIKSLLKSRGTILPLDRNLLFEAFRRIERYPLNIFDLIHYVTALTNNCAKIISYDNDFDNLEIKREEP
ncbi:PIN domain-containing protein [Candidatus Woesearchaeota archaeon]|nr:PIN domain-containing protein [Candidatus Woesearchaeota archaeon]